MHVTLLPFLIGSTLAPAQDDAPDAPAINLVVKHAAAQTFSGSFEVSEDIELVETTQLQDGEEMPSDMMPAMERTSSNVTSFEFTESIGAVDDANTPTEIARTYDGIAGEFEFAMSVDMEGAESFDDSGESESAIDGERITFEREDGAFIAKPSEESDLTEEDVSGLRADLSLAFLAPAEEKALNQGDSWTISTKHFESLFELGGDLQLESDNMAPMMHQLPGDEDAAGDVAGPEREGVLKLTYKGMVKIDDMQFVEITLEGELTNVTTTSPDFEIMTEGGGDEDMLVPEDMSNEVTDTRDCEGTLLWDPATSTFVKLSLTAEITRTSVQSMTIEFPGMGEMEIESTEVEEGTAEIAFERVLAAGDVK